jgi:hypothetical protein
MYTHHPSLMVCWWLLVQSQARPFLNLNEIFFYSKKVAMDFSDTVHKRNSVVTQAMTSAALVDVFV